MADYPASLWTGNTRGANLSDAETHTTWHDEAMAEVIAVETELGTAPRGAQASVKARLDLYDQATTTWSSPVFAGLTVGNGTTTASYYRLGKLVVASFRFVLGTTSAVTGSIQLTLPVTSISRTPYGVGAMADASAATSYQALVQQTAGTTVVSIAALVASGTYTTTSATSSIIPFTWTTSDEINVTFQYLTS